MGRFLQRSITNFLNNIRQYMSYKIAGCWCRFILSHSRTETFSSANKLPSFPGVGAGESAPTPIGVLRFIDRLYARRALALVRGSRASLAQCERGKDQRRN